MNLNNLMAADTVVTVREGEAYASTAFHAPEVRIDTDEDGSIMPEHEDDMVESLRRQGWEPETGWTGQYLYSGAIMHPSEYIGGSLARHILETPGYWATCEVETDGDELAGWLVAHRPFEHHSYPHENGRFWGCARCESECFCTGEPGEVECVYCSR